MTKSIFRQIFNQQKDSPPPHYTKRHSSKGFTLSEVLITLGIIGVVAAFTTPLLMNIIQDFQQKNQFKKAYADLNQSFSQAQSENALLPGGALGQPTANAKYNFRLLQSYFNVMKSCNNAVAEGCWIDSCTPTINDCWGTTAAVGNQGQSVGFVDSSGREWIHYKPEVALWIMLDTNGDKKPNRLGQDRFRFVIQDQSGGYTGIPSKIYALEYNWAFN